jgi:outer membrane autotransporter protein
MRPYLTKNPLFHLNNLKMKMCRNLMPMDQTEHWGEGDRGGHIVTPNLSLKYAVYVSILIVGLMMGDAIFSISYAQNTNLGNRAGQTRLQSVTGTGVQIVCGGFATGNPAPSNSKQQDLFERCREMVQTANDIDDVGNDTNSLGLDDKQLAAALQQLATEEVVAPRTMATKTFNGQLQNLGARLAALRLGARGFSVAGLNFDGLNRQAGLSPEEMGSFGFPQRGGGASGDSGEGAFSRLSAFANGIFSTGDKDATDREDGFDFDSQGVTVGVDYRFLNELVLGTAFTYSHFDADFNRSSTNAGGDSDTDGYVFSLYGTYYLENFYFEGVGSLGWADHDAKRRIEYASSTAISGTDRTAKSDTDSTQYSFSFGTGYNAQVGSVDFGPYARLTYFKIDIDDFKETGAGGLNLQVEDQKVQSLISALGVRASKSFSWERGVWSPQIRGEWNHEYKNEAENITSRYVNDPNNNRLLVRTEDPDRDFFRFGATLANVAAGGTQVFFDYETMLGFRDISNHIFTFGARQEF